jgi:hypothetical protein
MYILLGSLVKPHEVDVFPVENGLPVVSEVIVALGLLLGLVVHCAWSIVELIIILFLLQSLGEFVRLEELAELLARLKLGKNLLASLLCFILSLEFIPPVLCLGLTKFKRLCDERKLLIYSLLNCESLFGVRAEDFSIDRSARSATDDLSVFLRKLLTLG